MSDFKPELLTHSKRSRRKRAGKEIRTWLLAGTLIVGISSVTLVYTYYSARAGFINIDVVREMPKASILYDYQGHAFSRFFDENRIALPTDQPVPKLLGEAVVATEDRRFYNHGGIDPFGIVRASVMNLLHRGAREGGSTITQQLAPTTANFSKSFSRTASSWLTRSSKFSATISIASILARASMARRPPPTLSLAFPPPSSISRSAPCWRG